MSHINHGHHIDGTAARQLDLMDDRQLPLVPHRPAARPANLRLLQKDVYAELTRRRRRAQIAARHAAGV